MTAYPRPQQQKSFLRDLLEIFLLAIVLYIIINFAVQTVHVMGQSMEPTLQDNDFLIASKVSYRLHDPQRGDIVIFKPNNGEEHDYIKRIIALPGDHVRVDHAQIWINGHQLKESYLNEQWTVLDTWPPDGREQVVPSGSYVVMGDNRNHSTDSRTLGFQRRDAFLGKAWIRIWPLDRVTIFSSGATFAK